MNDFASDLEHRLKALREQNLFRELRRIDSPQSPHITAGGRPLLNFSSNDYLGLANDPLLKEAAVRAIERFGVGAGASRLVSGSLAPFHDLEAALADFKGAEAALTFSTGYATAIGAITALMTKDDVIILDKLVHASIVDAARLSGAKLRVFKHNDLADLEDKLRWSSTLKLSGNKLKPGLQPRTLVVTESIFSMDGDVAPLNEMVILKEKYGAWLMVDEAHATGIVGRDGRGLADELGMAGRVEVQMGTLGKALGASGGYVCGSRSLIDLLINRARSFIFSTAPVPATAAAATAAIQFVRSRQGEHRRQMLHDRIGQLHAALQAPPSAFRSAIVPVILGTEQKAIDAAAGLREQGIFVPAIRYPTVARGSARLRITLTATHSSADVQQLARALNEIIDHPS